MVTHGEMKLPCEQRRPSLCQLIDAESALRASTMKFRHRWELMEGAALDEDVSLEDLSVKELNDMWEGAKAIAGNEE